MRTCISRNMLITLKKHAHWRCKESILKFHDSAADDLLIVKEFIFSPFTITLW